MLHDLLSQLLKWDKKLFLFLNSKHFDGLDPIMLFLSSYPNWIVIFLFMAILIYIKGESWRKSSVFFFLLSVGVSALLTNVVKIIIERPRPIHNKAWNDIIHAIEGYESSYSFFSSHSSTTFAMATFFFLFFQQKNKLYGYAALIWSTIVAYSRIYLGKHYPLDVFIGILCGIIIGTLGYKLFERYKRNKELSNNLA